MSTCAFTHRNVRDGGVEDTERGGEEKIDGHYHPRFTPLGVQLDWRALRLHTF
jgi:hypothetical protein